MDLDEFRSFVLDSGIDVWKWIDMAISVASNDHEIELKNRRDGIIEKLYAPAFSKCQNCDQQIVNGVVNCEENGNYQQKEDVGCDYNTELLQEQEDNFSDDDDDVQRRVVEIKILLDDQNKDEKGLIGLLQRLVDMDITFKVLKETDIGRHVTRLRKHSSNEVRRLVKILVRKWKDTVDEWVRLNTPTEELVAQFNGDQELSHQSQHKNNAKKGVTTKVLPDGNAINGHAPYYLSPPKGKVKDKQMELDDYSAKKGLHGNSQEAQIAKKQRTTQVMDFHHNPKTSNANSVTSNRSSVPVKFC